MEKIIALLIILNCFLSCQMANRQSGDVVIINLEFVEDRLPDEAKGLAFDVVKNRANGLDNGRAKVSMSEKSISVELPGESNIELYKQILPTKGEFEISRAYLLPELFDILNKVNSEVRIDESKNDSSSLFSMLRLNLNTDKKPVNEPLLGFASKADTGYVVKLLVCTESRKLLPDNISFRWDLLESFQGFALYATEANPIVTKSMIDVKNKKTSSIRLKKEFFSDWAMFTNDNVSKYVLCSLDKKVFSSPVIVGKIDNGIIHEYTGFSINDKVWLWVSPAIQSDLLQVKLQVSELKAELPDATENRTNEAIFKDRIKKIFASKVYLMVSFGNSATNNFHAHLHMFNSDGINFFPVYTSPEDLSKVEMIMPKALPFDGILFASTVNDSMVYKINYGLEDEMEISGKEIKKILDSEIKEFKAKNSELLKSK